MFCVRREDRESEWLAFVTQDVSLNLHSAAEPLRFDSPQPWPLHEAVAYVNQNRAEDYPVAVFAIDDMSEEYPEPMRQVYPHRDI